jgi:hypothetical protein
VQACSNEPRHSRLEAVSVDEFIDPPGCHRPGFKHAGRESLAIPSRLFESATWRPAQTALFMGRIFDDRGNRMTPSNSRNEDAAPLLRVVRAHPGTARSCRLGGMAKYPRPALLGPQDRQCLEQAAEEPARESQAGAPLSLDDRDQEGPSRRLRSLRRNLGRQKLEKAVECLTKDREAGSPNACPTMAI